MKRVLKCMAVALLLVMMASMLMACSGKSTTVTKETTETTEKEETKAEVTTTEETEASSGIDTSEFVKLNMVLMGSAPKDTPEVLAELNKKLKTDLNAALEISHIDWSTWTTKYKLVLAAGEPIDIIYTAWWCFNAEQTQKGAFLPLDEVLPKAAPNILSQWPKTHWGPASYKGKIYSIPSYEKTYGQWGIGVRGDLREKYGLPVVNSFETYEAYLDTIKANEPGMMPLNVAGLIFEENHMLFIQHGFFNLVTSDTLIGVTKADQKDITNVVNFAETAEFEVFAKLMRSWFEKGYWSKSVLSNKVNSTAQMENNLTAAANLHFGSFGNSENRLKAKVPEATVEFWTIYDNMGVIHPTPVMQNAVAFPKTCKNLERAVAVVEKLNTDEEYNKLIMLGIKGKHWEEDADGNYKLPDGLEPADNGYQQHALGQWAFRNPEFTYENTSWPENVKKLNDHYDTTAVPDKLDGFNFDKTSVQSETAAIDQVLNQYLSPLLYGTVKDTEAGIELLREKLKAAGADKVIDALRAQLIEFAKERGY